MSEEEKKLDVGVQDASAGSSAPAAEAAAAHPEEDQPSQATPVRDEKPVGSQDASSATTTASPAPATPVKSDAADAAASPATPARSSAAGTARTPLRGAMTEDEEETASLKRAINTLGLFYKHDDRAHRERVLSQILLLARQWIASLSEERGMPKAEAANLGAKLFTYGSYRLGVFNAESDIDVLIVGPRNINRNDFLTQFPAVLRRRSEATEVTPVTEAYIPLVKVIFDGIDLDLQYTALPMTSIPDDLSLNGDDFMRNLVACPDWDSVMDYKSIRSLNGTRDTDMLLEVVPKPETYRVALRLLRFWAKERGLYGNKVGFPGGFAWSVMLARVCQMFPEDGAAKIMKNFFKTLRDRRWEPSKPLCLVEVKKQEAIFGTKIGEAFEVWGDQPLTEDGNLMPVITPAFPSMNSTFNVTKSTRQLMVDEFDRGYRLLTSAPVTEESWYKLCERTNFLSRFKHFFRVDIFAQTEELFSLWKGLVEARLRFISIEVEKQCPGMLAQPLLESFHPDDSPQMFQSTCPGLPVPQFSAAYFLGIKRIDTSKTYTLPQLRECGTRFLRVIRWEENSREGKFVLFTIVTRESIPPNVRAESAERASVKPSLYAKKRFSSSGSQPPHKKKD